MKHPFLIYILLFSLFSGISVLPATAQKLKPGFDKAEYINLLKVSSKQRDSLYHRNVPAPHSFKKVYRSPVVGMDNRWDLWVSKDSVAVISIRGTTRNTISWVENFYAAMVPASGQLRLTENQTFDYHLSEDPKAAVHAGWLLGMAYLAPDVVHKMDSLYQAGTKDFVVLGHSQGGAIAYLMTSHLHDLKRKNRLPQDITIKTYASAAPKPGNLYYAYAYEALTQGGWAYNVVNSADWVPETPISIQTLDDFNNVNPFKEAKGTIKKQKFPQRLAFGFVHKQLDKPTRRAMKRYQKYLGNLAGKYARKHLPDLGELAFVGSSNYTRAGNYVVLLADEDYYKEYPEDNRRTFGHHLFDPYLYLAEKLPENLAPAPNKQTTASAGK